MGSKILNVGLWSLRWSAVQSTELRKVQVGQPNGKSTPQKNHLGTKKIYIA